MSYVLTGARAAVRGRATRAVVVSGTVVAGTSTALARPDQLSVWWSPLSASRWWEAGLLCVALVASLDGAGLVATGTTRRWWCAGATRDEALAWAVLRALGAALVVAGCWVLVSVLVVVVRRGVPTAGTGSEVLDVAFHFVAGLVLVAILASLVGAAAGRTWTAAGLVLLATLPFSSELLDIVPQPPGWTVGLSPVAAGRAVVAGGTGSALGMLDVSRGPLLLAAAAAIGWAVTLTAVARARPLVPAPRARGTVPTWVPVTAALALMATLGAIGPHVAAPRVPWMLQPSWRDQRAHGRSATQVAGAWLRCQAHPEPCGRFEVAAGVTLGDGARQVLSRQRRVEVQPDSLQGAPDTVDARIEVEPVRSGQVVVRYAAVRVHLVPDGDRWRVSGLDGPVAVMGS